MKITRLFFLLAIILVSCSRDSEKCTVSNFYYVYDIDFFQNKYPGLDGAYIYMIIQDAKWEKIIKNDEYDAVYINGIHDKFHHFEHLDFMVRKMNNHVYMVQCNFKMEGDVCEYLKNKKKILDRLKVVIKTKNNGSLVVKHLDISKYQIFFDSLIKGVARPDNSKCK